MASTNVFASLATGFAFTPPAASSKLAAVCGRYALAGDWSQFTAQFDLQEVPGWRPRYNIAPSATSGHEAPIILPTGMEFGRFWYIPGWWHEPISKLPTSFNARAETVFSKPFFRGATRCLVPASSWREFPGERGAKRAFTFHLPPENDNEHPPGEAGFFAFCGIASHVTDRRTDRTFTTYSIITSEPSPIVKPLHDRMPVIIPAEQYNRWLNQSVPGAVALAPCLEYSQRAPLIAYESSTYGNNTRHDGPRCIEPIMEQKKLFE